MTTNKPNVQRYDDTGCPEQICRVDTMHESDDGDYILYEDYEALQAECEKLREDAEFGRSVLSKREPGKVYGCHCDLDEGMEPDGCVIDSGERHNCIYAKDISVKEQCSYWRVIASDADPKPAEQQPDVSELVEALERIARHPRTRGDELGYAGCRNIAKEALAAHRKGAQP